MKPVERIDVVHDTGLHQMPLGSVTEVNKTYYFAWSEAALDANLAFSPIRMPLTREVIACPKEPFNGLPGLLADSLPDGWGRLLVDRSLSARGIDPATAGPLERLALVGSKGPGALTFYPAHTLDTEKQPLDLDHVAESISQIHAEAGPELLDLLLENGGSSGGARPKINVWLHPETLELKPFSHNAPKDFEAWLIKFPASTDPPDVGLMEFGYSLLAQRAGIEMAACRIIETPRGRRLFATQRFDRKHEERIHMLSLAGLLHDNFRFSALDYGHVMDAAFKLEHHVRAYEKILRIAAFNVFTHNRDDHSKNLSFLMSSDGQWRLAPAYDLTWSSTAHGQHSLTVGGEGRKPGRKHLLELAEHFGVKRGAEIIEEVASAANYWPELKQELGISGYKLPVIDW